MTATPTPIGRRTAIRWFAELSRDDVPFAGGKGANLGELTRAGLPGAARLRGRRAGLRGVLRQTRLATRIARARPASTSTTRRARAAPRRRAR